MLLTIVGVVWLFVLWRQDRKPIDLGSMSQAWLRSNMLERGKGGDHEW